MSETYLENGVISWLPEKELSYDQWEREVQKAWDIHSRMPWVLGDMLLYGERMFGEDYAAAIPDGTRAAESLRVYLWVASRIDPSRRVAGLSWTHHRYVAGLPTPEEQDQWLSYALVNGWSSNELRERLAEAQHPGKKDADEAGESDGPVKVSSTNYAKQVVVLRGILSQYLSDDDVEDIVQQFLAQLDVEVFDV